jgi:hypothetical protein
LPAGSWKESRQQRNVGPPQWRFLDAPRASIFQPRRKRIERRRVRNLLAEKTLSIRQPTVDDQALLPVVHAEGTHGAGAINRLKPKLADSKTGPVIEL